MGDMLVVAGNASVWLHDEHRQITTMLADLSRNGWERLSADAVFARPRRYARRGSS